MRTRLPKIFGGFVITDGMIGSESRAVFVCARTFDSVPVFRSDSPFTADTNILNGIRAGLTVPFVLFAVVRL